MIQYKMKQQKRLQRQKEQAEQLYSSFSVNSQQLSFKQQDSVTSLTTSPSKNSLNCIPTSPSVMSNNSINNNENNNNCVDFDHNGYSDAVFDTGDSNATIKRQALKNSPSIVLSSCTTENSELTSESLNNNSLIGNKSKRKSTTFTTTACLQQLREQQFSQTLQINNQLRQLNAKNISNRYYSSGSSNNLQISNYSNSKRRPRSIHYHPIRCISPNLDFSLEQSTAYEMLDRENKESTKLHSSGVPQVIVLGPPSSGKTSLISRFNYFLTRPLKEKYQNPSDDFPPLLPLTSATIGVETYRLEVTENRDSFWLHSSLLTSSNRKSTGSSSSGSHRRVGTASRRTSSSTSSSQMRRSSSLKLKQILQVREIGGKNGWMWTQLLLDNGKEKGEGQRNGDRVDVVIYVMDISNPCQMAQSITHITSLLNNPQLQDSAAFAFVLNKRDSPCAMSGVRFENMTGLNKLLSTFHNHCITIETSCRTMQNIQKLLTWVVAVALNE